MRIASDAYPDPTQFDAGSNYYDAKSDPDEPRWLLRDVEFVRKLARPVTLKELKAHPRLEDFQLNKRGNRLSIFPVTAKQWRTILSLENRKPAN